MSDNFRTGRSDVVWNYIGTVVSMAGNFVMLPFLVHWLNAGDLGLWYAFLAIANLTLLFEFGFNPTFSRNFLYCLNGARSVVREGIGSSERASEVDWRLFNCLLVSSRWLYGGIASIVTLFAASVGTLYVMRVARDSWRPEIAAAWAVMCVAIFLNLYYFYTSSLLRGCGDVVGENRARTLSKLTQIAFTSFFLVLGGGLGAACLGYLFSGAVLRFYALRRFKCLSTVREFSPDQLPRVSFGDVRECLRAIGYLAWRDGLVQLSNFASTQAMTIVCSISLGLEATSGYSILLQFATAISNFASSYLRSTLPEYQASYFRRDLTACAILVRNGVGAFWLLSFLGTLGVGVAFIPLARAFAPEVRLGACEFIALAFYLFVWNQRALFCNYIASTNRIPYFASDVLTAIGSVLTSFVLCSYAHAGIWGAILGPLFVQLLFSGWFWPRFVVRELGVGFFSTAIAGVGFVVRNVFSMFDRRSRL